MATTLSIERLYRRCGEDLLPFESTEEVPPLEGIIAQDRALRAIDFALSLRSDGFNLYVLGETGTGKTSAIRSLIAKLAKERPTPSDWCYVYNFRNPDAPTAISLQPGQAPVFQRECEELVGMLKIRIPRVFESKEYERQRSALIEGYKSLHQRLLGALEQEAASRGFSIRSAMGGFSIVAVNEQGEPVTEEAFNTLDEKRKEELRAAGRQIQERLDDMMRTLRREEKATKERLEEFERHAALSVLGPTIGELAQKYAGNEKLVSHLEDMREDILRNLDAFKPSGEEAAPPPLPFLKIPKPEPDFSRYMVNVIVQHSADTGSPCVFESNPTYNNLFGRIEHRFQYGAALTDFTMIKAGSLHRANGGFLVVDALDLLRNVFSYEALKRAIRNREVKIEDLWEQYRAVTMTTMKPEPIPLEVKVILIGSPEIYHLLYNLDEEYRDLFKVKADFDNRMERTEETIRLYAAFVSAKVREGNLLPVDRSGVARIVEHGSRLAEHQEKISSRFSEISNLIREAHYWAGREGERVISRGHVERALREKRHRHNRIEERIRELMREGTLIVETSGSRTGQVNGLAVLDMGDYRFGKPSRITTTVYAGKGGVVNIERETKLSGKIHEKAILILTHYLGKRYAGSRPISLSASITFEQLYGMIEGDSATCAEFYSLLSAIAEVPIRQGIAVTGSMDQNGTVQPVGGINEKVEGFFELCRARGLTGEQGVLLPEGNVRNLMLGEEVLRAVAEGSFRIYSISHVEEGIELLTGLPAGEPGPDGRFPEGSMNRRVEERLTRLREAMKREERRGKGKEANDNESSG
ncbi:MAG: ATP-binding protein [Deltaproteobacteria bacterium]